MTNWSSCILIVLMDEEQVSERLNLWERLGQSALTFVFYKDLVYWKEDGILHYLISTYNFIKEKPKELITYLRLRMYKYIRLYLDKSHFVQIVSACGLSAFGCLFILILYFFLQRFQLEKVFTTMEVSTYLTLFH